MIQEFAECSDVPINILVNFGNYKYLETIGHGSYSVVIKAFDEAKNIFVACKVVNRKELHRKNMLDSFEGELRIIERLNHPNIAKIYEIIYYTDVIIIVMEYCQCGDLYEYINSHGYTEEEEKILITKQILSALSYLHSRGIAHRDIKPENIVFDASMNAKLIDFGFCKETTNLMKTKCGSPYYISPEAASGIAYDGKLADIWSFGVVVYYLAVGDLPWKETNEIAFMKNLINRTITIEKRVYGPLSKVIDNTLVFDPKERMSADDLLGLSCFVGIQSQQHVKKTLPFCSQNRSISSTGRVFKKSKFIVRPCPSKQLFLLRGRSTKEMHLVV